MEVWNLKKAELRRKGYRDVEQWLENPAHVYIGRDMSQYVPGAVGSKWGNPFTLKYSEDKAERVEKYRNHIKSSPALVSALPELVGKKLGCWCHPEPCHGDVLMELVRAYSLQSEQCTTSSAAVTQSKNDCDSSASTKPASSATAAGGCLGEASADPKQAAATTASEEPQAAAKATRRKKRGVLQHSWTKSQGESLQRDSDGHRRESLAAQC